MPPTGLAAYEMACRAAVTQSWAYMPVLKMLAGHHVDPANQAFAILRNYWAHATPLEQMLREGQLAWSNLYGMITFSFL